MLNNRSHDFFAKTVVKIIVMLVFAGLLVSYVRGNSNHRICFNNYCFDVEIAVTPQERAKGLMFREHLFKDSGMIFVYKDENIYPFWMKNTKIPLDIIWLNKKKEIVFIKKNAVPCGREECILIYPDKLAKYVLEINAGSSRNIGLKLKEKARFYNISSLN